MAPASLEGQTLGKYRVLESLGRGGMARVYRAYHPQLDRYVAVKVLRSDLVEDEEFLARFRREARAVAALRHPNIVQVFDADVQGDTYYMVLELLEGDTLKARLNDYRMRGEKMPLGEVVRVLLDVLNGLAYAHGEGMVHRDIKTANILLTKRGQAVIADFGVAQMVGSTQLTVSGALMGTLSYMAPEQGLEGISDVRSDIYSLGIVFYEMLTQRTPFDADTPLAVLMKHLNDPLPLPRKIAPTIPEPLERIVLKALAKQPEDRYQSAEEMAQALRGAVEEAEIEVPERVSSSLSFTTPEAPSESVAVFSGAVREKITDVQFADDDTDATLGQRLAAEGTRGGQTLRRAGKDLLGAVGAVAHVAMSRTAEALRKAANVAESETLGQRSFAAADAQPAEGVAERAPGRRPTVECVAGRKERVEARPERGHVGRAILGGIGLVILGNLVMLTVALPTGHWQIYERGWPMEIFLVSWGLCLIMYVTSCIWLLIPIGPVLGTGMMLTYCALTGNWEHWSFLWLVEVWIAVGSILIPILLAGSKSLARGLSRLLGVLLSVVSIAAVLTVGSYFGLSGVIVWIADPTRMIAP